MNADPREHLTAEERQHWLSVAVRLADVCADAISNTAGQFEVEAKADASLVTSADIAAEEAFREVIAAEFPSHGVLGEEKGLTNPDGDFRWIVDPIDGTAEFARGMPTYGTIIGLWLAGRPLLGVIDHQGLGWRLAGGYGLGLNRNGIPVGCEDQTVGGETVGEVRIGLPSRAGFTRRGDQGHVFDAVNRAYPECRTFHTCFSHSCALVGALDAAVEWAVPIWDLGALEALCEAAGAAYHCVQRAPHPLDPALELYSVVFGRPAIADELAAVVARSLDSGSP